MNYHTLATKEIIDTTAKALSQKGYQVYSVDKGSDALIKIKEIIPPGASVINGSSVTLEQIGYNKYLTSASHGWVNLHARVNAENDKIKRSRLRKQAVLSDYYLGSVHALIQNGEFIIASNTGSQLPHVVFTSANLIFVVSIKKIVPTLAAGMTRLEKQIIPLENTHMKNLYGTGTAHNKLLVFKGEAKFLSRKIYFILVNENLGF